MFSTIPFRLTLIILFTLAIVFASRQSALVQKSPLAPTCAPTPSGLVSFWPGDGNANDLQGANNGALEGNTAFVDGFVGPAFSFDGASSVLFPSINIGSAFTVEFWVFPTSPGGFQYMVSNGYTSSNFGALYLLGNSVSYWQGGAAQATTASGSVPTNTWTHVALTYDGSAGAGNRFDRIYINGSLAATSADHAETFNNPLRFAFSILDSDLHFRGLMDETAIYGRALSAPEIQSISDAGVAGKCIAPSLFIRDASTVEGNAGATNASFTVKAVRHSNAVSVNYATADNTATAPSDYQSQSGALNFPVDSVSTTVNVPVNGDTTFEVDETFFVNLSGASNATIQDGQGVGTIINDDCFPLPAGTIGWWPGENNANDVLSGANGTLENGATFAPGEVGQAFSFDGVNDSVLTPAINIGAAFTVELWVFPTSAAGFQHLVSNSYLSSTNYGALYFSGDHFVYYQNGFPQAASGSIPLNQWTHVALTYDGSVDRLYVNGGLAGASSAHSETFINALRFGYSATPTDNHFQGRLDEISLYSRALSALEVQSLFSTHNTGKCPTTPNLLISDVTLTEGDAGTKSFTFTVSATHSIGSAITVDYATADGTATAPSDYAATSGTLTIPANNTSATVTVQANGDTAFELDETFFVNLTNATNANILDAQGVGTIINDDCFPPPSGLVAWWPAENNAVDIQGANNGLLENGANFGGGEVGQAFSFDGLDDSVLTPLINIGAAFTVELWMFPTSTSSFQHMVSNDFTSANYGGLYYRGDFVTYYQNGLDRVDSGAVPLNQWTHVALTYDGSADRLYINGSLVATSAGTHSENFNNALRFGYAVVSQDNHFQGKLDEITLFNRALTGAEVLSVFSARSKGKCVGAVNPIATWTGAANSDWNTAANWSAAAVPAATDDVVVPGSGVTNELVISSSDVTVNSLSITAGRTLTVNGGRILTVNGTLVNGGTLAGAGAANFHGAAMINSGVVSVANFNFNRAGVQRLNGVGSFASNAASVMSGSTMTLVGDHQMSTLAIQGGATMDVSSRTLSLSGSFMNSGALTITGSTIVANGASPQTLTNGSYNNLSVNNGAGVSLGSNALLGGVLTLTTDLTTGAFILTMPDTASSTGGGDVVGNVRRTGAFPLSFGNPFNLIAISGGVAPTDVTVNLVKAAPVGFPTAIARTYTITPTGGSGFTATLRLHYKDSELNGNTEGASLNLFRFDGTNWRKEGQTAFDTTDNWVQKSGVTQFSPWTLNSTVPTEASLESFTAIGYDAGVLLEWKTGYELDNLGFNIYRDEGGKRALINPHVIAGSALAVGQGVTLRAGRSYAWWDVESSGKATSYWIEDLDLNGSSRWYGPVGVQAPGLTNQDSARAIEQAKLLADLGRSQKEPVPVEPRAKPAAATAAASQQQFALASGPAVKISVKQEGWYRVTQPELIAAGLNPAVDPRLLQLYVDGQQLPISVIGEGDGRLDPSDSAEFYGVGLDSPFSDLRVYWLVAAKQPGLRIASVPSQSWPSTGGSFAYTVERRDRTVYFSALRNGEVENFFGAVIASQPVSQTITVRHSDSSASQPAALEVALQGVTNQPHQVRVQLNGVDLGLIAFNGQGQGVTRFSVAAGAIAEGQNQIVLTNQGSSGDVSLVDYIRLTYQHGFIADDDALRLTVSGQQQLTIGGYSRPDIRVFDVTNPSAVQELMGSIEEQKTGYGVSLRVPGSGQKSLVAVSNSHASVPVQVAANVTSNWGTSAHGADLIILTHRDFTAQLQPLVSARQKQGLSVAVVDVEDVYDEFSFGQKTPYAIRDFFSFAKTNWKKPPRYALLVGDASYDPKNYLGAGSFDLVPTRLIDTTLMEAASDDWLVDFNQDGIAEVAIGRLPVRTADEAQRMIARIIGYDQSRASEETLLVADRNDGYDFEGANDALRAIVNGDVRVVDIRRGQMSDAEAKTRLIDAINRGQKIVNYSGHGSVDLWRAGLLTSADARMLKNSDHLSVFVLMSCLNGYFDDPLLDSLAEAMMKAPEGGAVAVWASSAMTTPEGQASMNEELYRQLFRNRGMMLGDSIKNAKAAITDSDVRRSWILLGDPAMRLR